MTRTREENTRYMADYRAGLRSVIKSGDPDVPDLDTRLTVEESVRREVRLIDGAAARSGLVAAALQLAKLLDDQSASTRRVWPAAANQLRAVLGELRAASAARPTSRLQQLRDQARSG